MALHSLIFCLQTGLINTQNSLGCTAFEISSARPFEVYVKAELSRANPALRSSIKSSTSSKPM
jgi:hypothetical protein